MSKLGKPLGRHRRAAVGLRRRRRGVEVGRRQRHRAHPAARNVGARVRAGGARRGAGAEDARLRRLAVKHGAQDRVELPGRVNDMASEMQQASIFALSSRFEGFPMVLLEAMSKGLPVVAFDCPTGPADIIEDGRTGLLVPAGDVNAFAAALLDLIRDAAKRRTFGAAGAERAAAFSMERVGAAWEELLRELLDARRPSSRAVGGA